MNVNYIASSALTATYPIIPVQIYFYVGQTNDEGEVTPIYSEPVTINSNIQLTSPQHLKYIDGFNQTTIYKDFWINNDQITGLNRNISTAGDYIKYDNLQYKIVAVDETFKTDWVRLTGAQCVVINE